MIDQRMLSRENFGLSDQRTEACSIRNKNPGQEKCNFQSFHLIIKLQFSIKNSETYKEIGKYSTYTRKSSQLKRPLRKPDFRVTRKYFI